MRLNFILFLFFCHEDPFQLNKMLVIIKEHGFFILADFFYITLRSDTVAFCDVVLLLLYYILF